LGAKLDESLDSAPVIHAIDETLGGVPGTRSEVFLPYPIARYFEVSVWRLPDLKSTGPAWAMVVLHDVTESKKAAQLRADFVANVSHELRSPLSSLLGFIETLRGPARDDPEATE
jgi:two-component system phosphate regulon sensor histidine kinase PhoR